MENQQAVLIVGAGPTGLMAAVELSRMGIEVRIVDRLLQASKTSRALAVQARTMELLENRGPGPEMLRLCNRAVGATVYSDGQTLGHVDLAHIKSRYNFISLLSQSETERLLTEQLARQGVQIERGSELAAIAQPDSIGVRAVIRHPRDRLEEINCSYLVCAEGAHSLVRRTLNLDFKGKSLEQNYALADVHLTGDVPSNELSIFTARRGFLGIFPLGPGHFRLIASDATSAKDRDVEPSLEEMQALYNDNSHIPAKLHDLVWSSRFKINSRMLHHLREHRIFFGGDSAHIHSPAGGQGMNTGIQDMINLCWKLAFVLKGLANPEILDTYEAERLPIIRSIVTKTEAATNAMNSKNAIVHGLINKVVPHLLDSQFVQAIGTNVIGEISANYRASALSEFSSQNFFTDHALRSGDRLSDFDLTADDGDGNTQIKRVYEVISPSHFTLLVVKNDSVSHASYEALARMLQPWSEVLMIRMVRPNRSGAEIGVTPIGTLLAGGPDLYLVRPDAYLGFVGGLEDAPRLERWLQRWFLKSKGAS